MTEQTQNHLYVRLRLYDKKAGNLVKRYDFRLPKSTKYLTFTRAGVWHKVDQKIAEQLRLVRQQPGRPLSPPVFDVCTLDEAKLFDAQARASKEAQRRIEEPTVDTAVDLRDEGRGDVSLDDLKVKPLSRAAALDAFNLEAGGDNEEGDESGPPPVAEELQPSKEWKVNALKAECRRRNIPLLSKDNTKDKLLALLNK